MLALRTRRLVQVKMRFSALVLLTWSLSSAAGFAIRNIHYVDTTDEESNRMPLSSLIQVEASEEIPFKLRRNPERFPQMHDFHTAMETPILSDFLIELSKRRIRRELSIEETLLKEIQDLMMSGSTFERPRQERTLIVAPLFQATKCSDEERLDRNGRCKKVWP